MKASDTKAGDMKVSVPDKGSSEKPWPAATSDKVDSAMIGGVANGRPLTRDGRKRGGQ